MGGELRATSAVGAGSCFTFTIPVELADAVTIRPAHAPCRVIGLAPNQPTYRLLVVDDDADNRAFLTELLGSVGFEVHEAANGVEAVAQYVNFHPRLIWMDIQLPIMNGYDATELIREYEGHPASLYPQTIIIALTGHVFEEERAKILAAGCDDVLRKPIKEADIFETLHRHVGVEYVYAEGDRRIEGEQPVQRLTPDALATVPADLLDALEQAVIRGNRPDIEEILDALRPQYAPVAEMVARLVKEFKYKEIWSMIQHINF
jgi:CheY-like chemotaxis protein